MDYYECNRFISQIEQTFFDSGPYGESVIIKDLQTRRAMDAFNPSGNELSNKKKIYYKDFETALDGIWGVIKWAYDNRQNDLVFKNRLIKCKNQLEKLQNIVRNF